jgi:methylase of polypeptide subunit release factors
LQRRHLSDSSLFKQLTQNSELDAESANDELRWMRQAILEKRLPQEEEEKMLDDMAQRRARGMPLQYILGAPPYR